MQRADWVMTAAVILGPILAVQVERLLARRRDRHQRKMDVFRTLMYTRAAGLSPAHVEALNRIDVEFYGDKKVTDAWKLYLDHLNDKTVAPEAWGTRTADFLAALLHEMARALDHDYDTVHIKRGAYYPKGYNEIDEDNYAIRKGLVKVLNGEGALPVEVTSMPVDEAFAKKQSDLWDLMIRSYKGDLPIAVKIIKPDDPAGKT